MDRRLRLTAQVLTVLRAVGAAEAVLYRGGANSPGLLVLLFVGWVVNPFVGLWFGLRLERGPVYGAACLIAIGSLLAYAYAALEVQGVKSTRLFLLVPLVSWMILGMSLWLGRRGRRI